MSALDLGISTFTLSPLDYFCTSVIQFSLKALTFCLCSRLQQQKLQTWPKYKNNFIKQRYESSSFEDCLFEVTVDLNNHTKQG